MIKIITDNLKNRNEIFTATEEKPNVYFAVSEIIEKVKKEGDEAVIGYTEKFDKVKLGSLRVTEEEFLEALKVTPKKFIKVIEKAYKNIYEFHKKQLRKGFQITKKGKVLGQKITPIEKVGIYVPGGTASYPSTVLMDSIPAIVAGCKQIVMVTPPDKNGKVNPYILAAASVAGVKEIYKVGGAQAVAALAYGTQTIPKVDKIVGPGNAFVAEAKRQVFGVVSIDMIAGPSEIMVIADNNNNPSYIAADLLSQAEHDRLASAVLVTDSMDFAKKVQAEIEVQLAMLSRSEIARASIDNYGKIIVTENIDNAIEVANLIAPEHLEVCLDNPFDYLDKIVNAGSVFLGKNCPEALGDYLAGTNHTLPTSGTARFSSP